MEEKKEGYNRYKVIFDNIRALCNVLDRPKKVIEGPLEGITEETCECDCKYYILGNGLHVYIRGEYIYISENDLQNWGDERGRDVKELKQFYLSYNKETIECICHANNGRPYTLVQYFNYDIEGEVAHEENREDKEAEEFNRVRWGIDNAFVPESFEDREKTADSEDWEKWNKEAHKNSFGELKKAANVPADIGAAITQHIGENTHQDIRVVCNRIIGLNEKIKEYERVLDIETLLQNEQELIELRRALEKLAFEILKIDKNNTGKIKSKVEDAVEIGRRIEEVENKIQRIRGQIRKKLEKNREKQEKLK